MLATGIVLGFLICWVLTVLVNNTTEYKRRRQASHDNAYRSGYYAGWIEDQKLHGTPAPPKPEPPASETRPRRRLFRRS